MADEQARAVEAEGLGLQAGQGSVARAELRPAEIERIISFGGSGGGDEAPRSLCAELDAPSEAPQLAVADGLVGWPIGVCYSGLSGRVRIELSDDEDKLYYRHFEDLGPTPQPTIEHTILDYLPLTSGIYRLSISDSHGEIQSTVRMDAHPTGAAHWYVHEDELAPGEYRLAPGDTVTITMAGSTPRSRHALAMLHSVAGSASGRVLGDLGEFEADDAGWLSVEIALPAGPPGCFRIVDTSADDLVAWSESSPSFGSFPGRWKDICTTAMAHASEVQVVCPDGFRPLYSGTSSHGPQTTEGSTDRIFVRLCENEDGDYLYQGGLVEVGDFIESPLCSTAGGELSDRSLDRDHPYTHTIRFSMNPMDHPAEILIQTPDGGAGTWHLDELTTDLSLDAYRSFDDQRCD